MTAGFSPTEACAQVRPVLAANETLNAAVVPASLGVSDTHGAGAARVSCTRLGVEAGAGVSATSAVLINARLRVIPIHVPAAY